MQKYRLIPETSEGMFLYSFNWLVSLIKFSQFCRFADVCLVFLNANFWCADARNDRKRNDSSFGGMDINSSVFRNFHISRRISHGFYFSTVWQYEKRLRCCDSSAWSVGQNSLILGKSKNIMSRTSSSWLHRLLRKWRLLFQRTKEPWAVSDFLTLGGKTTGVCKWLKPCRCRWRCRSDCMSNWRYISSPPST